jgi:hypothetical protein
MSKIVGDCSRTTLKLSLGFQFPVGTKVHSEVIPFLNQDTYIYRVQMDRRTFLEYLGAVARSGELGCQRLTPTNLRTSEGNSDISRLGKSCRLTR